MNLGLNGILTTYCCYPTTTAYVGDDLQYVNYGLRVGFGEHIASRGAFHAIIFLGTLVNMF